MFIPMERSEMPQSEGQGPKRFKIFSFNEYGHCVIKCWYRVSVPFMEVYTGAVYNIEVFNPYRVVFNMVAKEGPSLP